MKPIATRPTLAALVAAGALAATAVGGIASSSTSPRHQPKHQQPVRVMAFETEDSSSMLCGHPWSPPTCTASTRASTVPAAARRARH
jgi:hypothetical protein